MHGGLVEEFLYETRSPSHPGNAKHSAAYFVNWIIDRVDIAVASKIISVSRRMQLFLHEEKGVPMDKMLYFPNTVDLNLFRPNAYGIRASVLRRDLNLSGKFIVGYIGYFQQLQGFQNLIETAQLVKNPEIVFIIVGGSKFQKEGNIIILPKTSHHEIQPFYALCDILILPRPAHPATDIALPTKFTEYTAMGKPLLITDVGDPADLVRKYRCGIVVKNNNPLELLKGIEESYAKSQTELDIMGRRSRLLAENEFNSEIAGTELKKAIAGFQ
jgi:glycosyltransferase involved in cell wall biosynthesis